MAAIRGRRRISVEENVKVDRARVLTLSDMVQKVLLHFVTDWILWRQVWDVPAKNRAAWILNNLPMKLYSADFDMGYIARQVAEQIEEQKRENNYLLWLRAYQLYLLEGGTPLHGYVNGDDVARDRNGRPIEEALNLGGYLYWIINPEEKEKGAHEAPTISSTHLIGKARISHK